MAWTPLARAIFVVVTAIAFFVVVFFQFVDPASAATLIDYQPGATTGNTGLAATATSGGPCNTSVAVCDLIDFISPVTTTATSLVFWVGFGAGQPAPGTWAPDLDLVNTSNTVLSALTCDGSATGSVNAADWPTVTCTLDTPYFVTNGTQYKIRGRLGARHDSGSYSVFLRGQGTTQNAALIPDGCTLDTDECLARGLPGLQDQDTSDPYGAWSCYTSAGCPANFQMFGDSPDPRDDPVATWVSWSSGLTADASTLNDTVWRITSDVSSETYPDEDVGFYLAIWRGSSTSTAQLIYVSPRLDSNTLQGPEAYYAVATAPQFTHSTTSTAQYFLQVTAEVDSILGPISDPVDYWVTPFGSFVPDTGCEGTEPFYTSCFWINLLVSVFVPSPNSLGLTEWAETASSTKSRAPFAYFTQVADAISSIGYTTSTAFVLSLPVEVAGHYVGFDLPIKPTSTPWTVAYDNYLFPVFRFVIILSTILYVYHRVRDLRL